MRDVVLFTGVVVAFASLVTAHLALVFGLARRPPRWHALVALALPPLGLYWAWGASMRFRAGAWLASAVTYGVFLALASH